jgi:hypothetical protein
VPRPRLASLSALFLMDAFEYRRVYKPGYRPSPKFSQAERGLGARLSLACEDGGYNPFVCRSSSARGSARGPRALTSELRLAGTAAFSDDKLGAFVGLSAILWFRLIHLDGPLRRFYKLYLNPGARSPVPQGVVIALEAACAAWATDGMT